MRLQEWIHRMEEGGGARYVRWCGVVIGFAMLALVYNALCFRNFTNPETMDMAQLGRSIARGEGYITRCIRPLSIGLSSTARADKSAQLKKGHPDISNPPVYPLVLAGLQAVTPDAGNLVEVKSFNIYLPNLYIVLLNQALFGIGALLVFGLSLKWFNRAVAWMCALLFLLTELYWRFTMSGLSTILLMDLILVLVWLLSRFEHRARGAAPKELLVNSFAIGLVAGLAMLTRYSVGWIILPVLIFVLVCGAPYRWRSAVVVLVAFLAIITPWLARNWLASGLPFGTATYAVVEGTPVFAGDTLVRSLQPTLSGLPGQSWTLFVSVLHKGVAGIREIIVSDLPRLGGNWLWGFFLAGLLVRFQATNLNRLRWFVVGTLLLLIPVQAFARTHLATESPEINSENLLVLFSPLVLIFGVGLFFILFESLDIPSVAWRMGALTGFVVLISAPLSLAFLPPRPQANPAPYYPPRIQQVARYLEPADLWMSDIPWAVAWYGERQCLWTTLNASRAYFAVNDVHKTVDGLYLSARTCDAKFVSNWLGGTERGWAELFLHTFALRQVPTGFPLRYAPEGMSTLGELLLMDRDRWGPTPGGK
jgi:4-amino-4-deoxy-L-arabinose transferase-like glycosyltransferase